MKVCSVSSLRWRGTVSKAAAIRWKGEAFLWQDTNHHRVMQICETNEMHPHKHLSSSKSEKRGCFFDCRRKLKYRQKTNRRIRMDKGDVNDRHHHTEKSCLYSSHKMIWQTNLCMNLDVFIFAELWENISSKPFIYLPSTKCLELNEVF